MELKVTTEGEGFGPRGTAMMMIDTELPFEYDLAGSMESKAYVLARRAQAEADPTNTKRYLTSDVRNIWEGDDKYRVVLRCIYKPRYKDDDGLKVLEMATPEQLKSEFTYIYDALIALCIKSENAYRIKKLFDARINSRGKSDLDYSLDEDRWYIRISASRHDLPDSETYNRYNHYGYVRKQFTFTEAEAANFTEDDVNAAVEAIFAESREAMEQDKIFGEFKKAMAEFAKNFRLTGEFDTFIQKVDDGYMVVIRHEGWRKEYKFDGTEGLKSLLATLDIETFFKLAREWDLLPKPKAKPIESVEDAKARAEERARKRSVNQAKKDLNAQWDFIKQTLNQ